MNRWQLVQELFLEVTEAEPEDRARVLAERTGGDRELARQVEALVRADDEPSSVLDRTGAELLLQLERTPPAEELCGQVFGSYCVEAHLSSGGMGHVYRATHTSAGIERRVALKVLRHGLDTQAFLAGFQRERAALAALEHEHIVRFLDAGALPDGRPYFAMEFVDGVPLTEWVARQALATPALIELFLTVLGAVQYAHQKLVIHRDLKPSNVLVNGQGAPKLLDFGVAAVLEADGEEAPGLRVPLTPDYASPEHLAGLPVSTASDVYSLGVILHELLTGCLPGSEGVGRGPVAKRGANLGGDLDAILGRALAHDPAQRYPSADRFADDLRRSLAHQPVAARSAGLPYRSGRFLRRNRLPVVSGAAVLLALIAGWIGSDLNRRRAQAESSLGWGAHSAARHTARVFEDWVMEVAAVDGPLRSSAIERLQRALADEPPPETETLLRLALARLYVQDGDFARAEPEAERALVLAETTRGLGERDRRNARELRDRIAGEL